MHRFQRSQILLNYCDTQVMPLSLMEKRHHHTGNHFYSVLQVSNLRCSNKKLHPKFVITQISSVRYAPLIELHSETKEKLQNTTILGAMGWKKEESQFCHIYYSPYISSYYEIFTRPYRMCHVHSFASLIFLNRKL
jgi:hypothetical protein